MRGAVTPTLHKYVPGGSAEGKRIKPRYPSTATKMRANVALKHCQRCRKFETGRLLYLLWLCR